MVTQAKIKAWISQELYPYKVVKIKQERLNTSIRVFPILCQICLIRQIRWIQLEPVKHD